MSVSCLSTWLDDAERNAASSDSDSDARVFSETENGLSELRFDGYSDGLIVGASWSII